MMIPDQLVPNQSGVSSGETGCSGVLLVGAVSIWVAGVVAICQGATWLYEQTDFSIPIFQNDSRWLIGLVGGLALWIPLFFLARFGSPGFRPLFRTWRMMAELALLMVPARLFAMTNSQAVAGEQILALLVFLVGLRLTTGRKNADIHLGWLRRGSRLMPLAIGVGALLVLPWAAWGALGSILDVLLGILTALLAGIATALALEAGLFSGANSIQPKTGIPWRALIAAPLSLAILAFGLGLNMNEWLVAMGIIPLGWLALAFSRRADEGVPAWPAEAIVLAIGISGPLLWFDPDELAMIITSGQGELIDWAQLAGWVAAGLAVLAAVGAGLAVRRLARTSGIKAGGGVFAAVAWVGAALVFVLAGRPGFYGEHIFVILKDQADVSSAVTIPDINQRRSEVYQRLTAEAARSQADLRQALSRWGVRYQPFYLVNALEVEAGPVARLIMKSRPEVDRILDSPHLRPLPAPLPVALGDQKAPASPQWNLSLIRANRVWDELKVTGKGIVIGQSDSGVDGSHPEVSGQYRGRNGQSNAAWFDPWFHTSQPVDIGGHGTHTLATALGKTVGVAPDAEWIGCVNLARNLGNPGLYLDCMQFMLAPFPQNGDPFKDGRPEQGANVLNNSWGCPDVEGCDPFTFLPAVRALEDAGIFVVVSAGNDGDIGCGSVDDPPAIYQEIFAVGAVDSQGRRASFSSLGPVKIDGSNRTKPDIVAPGQQVLSAFPQNTYAFESGTSMAGPHVVGTVALMWSANPKLIGNIQRTRELLDASAQPYAGPLSSCGTAATPNDTVGYGMVDAYAAVQMAIKEK
jgi:subtilisin family serine protease